MMTRWRNQQMESSINDAARARLAHGTANISRRLKGLCDNPEGLQPLQLKCVANLLRLFEADNDIHAYNGKVGVHAALIRAHWERTSPRREELGWPSKSSLRRWPTLRRIITSSPVKKRTFSAGL